MVFDLWPVYSGSDSGPQGPLVFFPTISEEVNSKRKEFVR